MKSRTETRVSLALTLPNDVHEALAVQAGEIDCSVAAYIRRLLTVLAEEPVVARNLLDES